MRVPGEDKQTESLRVAAASVVSFPIKQQL